MRVEPNGRIPNRNVVQLSPRLNCLTFEKSTDDKSVVFMIGGIDTQELKDNVTPKKNDLYRI
jgi:hypothetical protein